MAKSELATIVTRQRKRESLEDQIVDLLTDGYPRLLEMMQKLPADKYVVAYIKLLNKLPQGKQNIDLQALMAREQRNRTVSMFNSADIDDVETK